MHRRAYAELLLPQAATPLVVTPDICFTYDPDAYPYNTLYHGAYRFARHYYPHVGDLQASGEEFECARYLDLAPQVTYWVRNLERKPQHAFWLQTSSDRFYPDFVCRLHDGRTLVVESKGAHLWSNDDSKEKRDLGELWAARSRGQCLFVMPQGADYGVIGQQLQ